MELNRQDIKDNEVIFGCAFEVVMDAYYYGSATYAHTYRKPVKGILKDGKFYELKKDGTPKKQGVYSHSRRYAKTYEECVKLFNGLVEDKQRKLRILADRLETEKIK